MVKVQYLTLHTPTVVWGKAVACGPIHMPIPIDKGGQELPHAPGAYPPAPAQLG